MISVPISRLIFILLVGTPHSRAGRGSLTVVLHMLEMAIIFLV